MRLQYNCKLLHNTHFTHKLRCMKAQHCPTPHSAIMYLLIGQASLSFGDRNCSDNGNHAWLFTIQVITAGQKQQVLEGHHSSGLGGGHFGRDKTLSKVSERCYWMGMVEDVKEFCETCDKCQSEQVCEH